MEIWKAIPHTNCSYYVSDLGNVKSSSTARGEAPFTQRIDWGGYKTVRFALQGEMVTRYVHRLVAQNFLFPDASRPKVNHLNGIKTDNWKENLEWATHSENIQHAYRTGSSKPIGKTVIDDLTGKLYPTIKSAALAHGLNPGTLRNYLNGNIKSNKTTLRFGKPRFSCKYSSLTWH